MAKLPERADHDRLDQLDLPAPGTAGRPRSRRAPGRGCREAGTSRCSPRRRRRAAGRPPPAARRAACRPRRRTAGPGGPPAGPGASPTNIRSASALPAPNTTLVRPSESGQRTQSRSLAVELDQRLAALGGGAAVHSGTLTRLATDPMDPGVEQPARPVRRYPRGILGGRPLPRRGVDRHPHGSSSPRLRAPASAWSAVAASAAPWPPRSIVPPVRRRGPGGPRRGARRCDAIVLCVPGCRDRRRRRRPSPAPRPSWATRAAPRRSPRSSPRRGPGQQPSGSTRSRPSRARAGRARSRRLSELPWPAPRRPPSSSPSSSPRGSAWAVRDLRRRAAARLPRRRLDRLELPGDARGGGRASGRRRGPGRRSEARALARSARAPARWRTGARSAPRGAHRSGGARGRATPWQPSAPPWRERRPRAPAPLRRDGGAPPRAGRGGGAGMRTWCAPWPSCATRSPRRRAGRHRAGAHDGQPSTTATCR